jgi:biotin operon repressor
MIIIILSILLFALALSTVFALLKTASDYDDHTEEIYRLHACISSCDKRVYNYLAEYKDWWPGYNQISHVLGMSPKDVKKSCQRLSSKGYLEFKKIRNKNGTLSGSGYFVTNKKLATGAAQG